LRRAGVGAGPAGIAAALAAGRSGARVILADEQAEPGGSLLAARLAVDGQSQIDGEPAGEWLATSLAELASLPEVRLLPRTTAFGYFRPQLTRAGRAGRRPPAARRPARRCAQRLWRVRARQSVLATGAIERPLVFATTTGLA